MTIFGEKGAFSEYLIYIVIHRPHVCLDQNVLRGYVVPLQHLLRYLAEWTETLGDNIHRLAGYLLINVLFNSHGKMCVDIGRYVKQSNVIDIAVDIGKIIMTLISTLFPNCILRQRSLCTA